MQKVGGHYQIVRQLASGGFGQTFVARDLHLPGLPLCVVKQLKAQSNAETLRVARRLFEQEAQVLYSLEHSQIPRLLAHFEEAQEFYLVQELVVGKPLSDAIVSGDSPSERLRQRWSEAAAIALLGSILRVLSYVHQQGVIHRDIKPDNLLQREDGQIVLIDFGAVKALPQAASTIASEAEPNREPDRESDRELSTLSVVVGTAGYMPVEQQGGKPRLSSDIYAVGITVIQAVTGLSAAQLVHSDRTGEIEWRAEAPQISQSLGDFLSKMVRYDFRHRYVDADAALAALSALPKAKSTLNPEVPRLKPARLKPTRLKPTRLKPTRLWSVRKKLLTSAPIALLCTAGGLFAAFNLLTSSSTLSDVSTDMPTASTEAEQTDSVEAERTDLPLDASETLDGNPDGNPPNLNDANPQNWALTIDGIEGGDAAFDEQNYQIAVERYLAALVNLRATGQPPELSDETVEGVHRRVCYSLFKLDRLEEADQACTDALALADARIAQQPNSAAAYYGRAQSLAGLRRFEEAQAAIEQARSLDPELSLQIDLLVLQLDMDA